MSKLYKKYKEMLKQDTLTESQIVALKSRISGMPHSLTSEEVRELKDLLICGDVSYKITQEHSDKGISYLKEKLFKINGKPRKTKQTRDVSIYMLNAVQDFSHFTFVGFYEVWFSLYGNNYQLSPIWRIHTNSGEYVDYCMSINLEFVEV